MAIRSIKVLSIVVLLAIGFACSSKPENATEDSGVAERKEEPRQMRMVPLATPNPAVVDSEQAVIETEYGEIRIRFYPDVAPLHVANFKKLTREKFYDGLGFHRLIPDNLIQGGDPQTRDGKPEEWGKGRPDQPRVPAEFSVRKFVKGTVGMARLGNDPNSGTSQFFISLTDHPEWDGRYTVFGEVIDGLETVSRIAKLPSDPVSQRAERKVTMKRVYLEKAAPQ
ncbi:MAG: peptidylprolyl isomerase [Acidobacteriota bacterium]